MEKPLSPVFDDQGTEVSRDAYWGQKEFAAALGTTAVYVGDLLRSVGLLQREVKEPTPEALRRGDAIFTMQDTADGPQRYHRWKKDQVLDVLRQAIAENPKPSNTVRENIRGLRPGRPTLDSRIEALERRVAALEGGLMNGGRT